MSAVKKDLNKTYKLKDSTESTGPRYRTLRQASKKTRFDARARADFSYSIAGTTVNHRVGVSQIIRIRLFKIAEALISPLKLSEVKITQVKSDSSESFFLYSSTFSIETALDLNEKMNDELIKLLDTFEFEELLKCSVIFTAENLERK
ncbi:hypothetical protein [Acinetobacter sp. 826659]|uniref:hypothetical protein n=1 Tax=Acinetobacter sp. 826659 TaxID=1310764 RepID=UPI0004494B44|nr:hypothetical protein [Acinetobacter sp. 826659]EXS35277.1 hypothetical protein J663_1188 [Acinetobacter sp. 826659]